MPDEPEALGLLALMLLHDARRDARVDAAGELVLLEDQDRARWDRARDRGGRRWWSARCALARAGPYALQAAIAAVHARAGAPPTPTGRDRAPVRRLRLRPLARGRAQPRGGGRDGRRPGAGAGADRRRSRGELDDYHLLHSARADLLRRLGRTEQAADSYRRARELTSNPSSARSWSAGSPSWTSVTPPSPAAPPESSNAAASAAATISSTDGTSMSATTSWIFGPARAASS